MIWFLFVACKSILEDSAIPIQCDDPPKYEDWTEGFLKGKCQSCHALNTPNRYGAPENVYFDTEEASLFWIDSIEHTVLHNETMPPEGGVTEEEKSLLMRWLDCH